MRSMQIDLVVTNVMLEDDNTEYECSDGNRKINSLLVLNVTGKLRMYTTQSIILRVIDRATIH